MQTHTQRGPVILLLLNETGERVSDILGFAASGYREALIANKGDLGWHEGKTIHFTSAIECPLLRRISTEQTRFDPLGCRRLDESDGEKFYRVSHSKWCGGRS